jgi:hypothetical protein
MLPLVNVLWPNSLAHSWMQATMIAIEQPSRAGAIPETIGFGSRISANCAPIVAVDGKQNGQQGLKKEQDGTLTLTLGRRLRLSFSGLHHR